MIRRLKRRWKAATASIPLIFTIWQSTPSFDYVKQQLVQISTVKPLRSRGVTPNNILDKLPAKTKNTRRSSLVRNHTDSRRDRQGNPKPKVK
jgi:hypothetical protein